MSADRLLTVAEAAEHLDISERHAYDLIAARDFPIPVYKVGRRWKVPPGPIAALLAGDRGPEHHPQPAATASVTTLEVAS